MFDAYRVFNEDGKITSRIVQQSLDGLNGGSVLIKAAFLERELKPRVAPEPVNAAIQGPCAPHESRGREIAAGPYSVPTASNPRFDQHAAMAQRSEYWRYRELASSHNAPVTMPEKVADLLMELAS